MTTKYAPGLNAPGILARARDWIGKSFNPGWCLYWCLVHVYKVPGLGDYDHDGDADCHDYWAAAIKRGRVVKETDPAKFPAGALAIWTSKTHGHAAVVNVAGKKIISTDLPTRGKVGEVDITMPAKKWGHKLVGYVEVDGNGFTLRRPLADPNLDPANYPPASRKQGSHITWLGQRLVAHGFGRHYKVGPGPKWSAADRANVMDFQKAQGWTGDDADGFPGPETLRRLAADPK